MLLVNQIQHEMPLGYQFTDTGAPRGEKNLYSIEKDGKVIYTSWKLPCILNFIRILQSSAKDQT